MKNKESNHYKPLVSIITPVFNGERYLEETIKSIINQSYENIELIIIDGGSSDGTKDIICKYDNRIDFWLSEPDNGQTDAINKGFRLAKGEILVWLNYDDLYFPDTVENIVQAMKREKAMFSYGHCQLIDEVSKPYKTLYTCKQTLKSYQVDTGNIFQGTVFFNKCLWTKYGPLDTSMKCSFEYKLFDEFFRNEKGTFINSILAQYRIHGESISSNYKELFEIESRRFRKPSSIANIFLYKIRRIILNTFNGNLFFKITNRCKMR